MALHTCRSYRGQTAEEDTNQAFTVLLQKQGLEGSGGLQHALHLHVMHLMVLRIVGCGQPSGVQMLQISLCGPVECDDDPRRGDICRNSGNGSDEPHAMILREPDGKVLLDVSVDWPRPDDLSGESVTALEDSWGAGVITARLERPLLCGAAIQRLEQCWPEGVVQGHATLCQPRRRALISRFSKGERVEIKLSFCTKLLCAFFLFRTLDLLSAGLSHCASVCPPPLCLPLTLLCVCLSPSSLFVRAPPLYLSLPLLCVGRSPSSMSVSHRSFPLLCVGLPSSPVSVSSPPLCQALPELSDGPFPYAVSVYPPTSCPSLHPPHVCVFTHIVTVSPPTLSLVSPPPYFQLHSLFLPLRRISTTGCPLNSHIDQA